MQHQTVVELLDMSELIYSDDQKVSDVDHFFSDKHTDLQVGIVIDDLLKRICVVFRGSESRKDWFYDFNTLKTQLKEKGDIYVHSGFYDQLNDSKIYDSLLIRVKNLLDENIGYAIYVTGHSLGGALATLFGYQLSFEVGNKITVVSFASPRVGNRAWKHSFNTRMNLSHYRISNMRDPIPCVPIILYYHTGTNICLKPKKCAVLPYFKIKAHDCSEYRERLSDTQW